MNDIVASEPKTGKLVQFPVTPAPSKAARSYRHFWMGGGLLALAVAIAAGGAWWGLQTNSTVHYTTVTASRGEITRAVTATGTVNPELNILIGTYVSGVIQELYCDYNTQVAKGQICAKIDPRPYQTIVDQNKANLDVAKRNS